MPPMPVTVTTVAQTDVEVFAEYPARVYGAREVEVRARVGGLLEQRRFDEGQSVESGQALFQIDAAPYAIALRQAEAEQANSQAAYNQAEREWRRIRGLFTQDAISERERDTALSNFELAEARLAATAARVAEAQLQLDYTQVPAPINGVTGLETVSEGSLVERGSLLTTIVQVDPLQIRFAIPERELAQRRHLESDSVEILLADGTRHPATLDFTAPSIDANTGSIRARATLPNPDNRLTPGQFVRVRVQLESLQNIVLLDPVAVSQGRDGAEVFLLNPDQTVTTQSVRLGPVVEGRQVIREGLAAGDRVVINGQVALQSGMTVSVTNPAEEAR